MPKPHRARSYYPSLELIRYNLHAPVANPSTNLSTVLGAKILPAHIVATAAPRLEAKSSLYTHFSELPAGLATVRAFGFQRALQKQHRAQLDRSQQPFYLLFAVQPWLMLVLGLVVRRFNNTIIYYTAVIKEN